MNVGVYDNLKNEEYHSSSGISKSGLDLINSDPASYIWSKKAPVDNEKLKVLDFGTDFHSYFLEPEEFSKNYKVMPKFNRRKPVEKKKELDLIEEWKQKGIIAVTDNDMKKLKLMRDSALAHPTVKAIMEMKNKTAERSIYWNHSVTGDLCKCRPDLMINGIDDSSPPSFLSSYADILVPDLKTTGDIDTIQKSIESFRYFVQDAFYTEGIEAAYPDSKVDFIFIFVSTKVNCGKYPVRVVRLSEAAKFDGQNACVENLKTYRQYKKSNQWESIVELDRPAWATREEDIY